MSMPIRIKKDAVEELERLKFHPRKPAATLLRG